MPHDPEVAERVRSLTAKVKLNDTEVLTEMKMFGGVCICINGKMAVGVEKARVMIRCSDEDLESGLKDGSLLPMDFTGRPMKNFAFVDPGSVDDGKLLTLIEQSIDYVRIAKLGPKKR